MEYVEAIYITNAYHSLSIERYKVTPELIERVSSGSWSSHQSEEDKQQRDAMAARGYFQAFGSVKETLARILKGKNSGAAVDHDHQK